MAAVPLVLQLQPGRSQVELRGTRQISLHRLRTESSTWVSLMTPEHSLFRGRTAWHHRQVSLYCLRTQSSTWVSLMTPEESWCEDRERCTGDKRTRPLLFTQSNAGQKLPVVYCPATAVGTCITECSCQQRSDQDCLFLCRNISHQTSVSWISSL